MRSADPRFEGKAPSIPGWPLPRPKRWLRREMDWAADTPAEPWYVGPLVFGTDHRRLVHLHAAQHFLTDSRLDEPWAKDPLAHFLELIVTVHGSEEAESLVQDESIPHGRAGLPLNIIDGDDVDIEALSDDEPPVWRSRTDAQWATIAGEPMRFAGSIDTSNNPFWEKRRKGSSRFYLFYGHCEGRLEFAITQADLRSQTIEEHERDEEVRVLWT